MGLPEQVFRGRNADVNVLGHRKATFTCWVLDEARLNTRRDQSACWHWGPGPAAEVMAGDGFLSPAKGKASALPGSTRQVGRELPHLLRAAELCGDSETTSPPQPRGRAGPAGASHCGFAPKPQGSAGRRPSAPPRTGGLAGFLNVFLTLNLTQPFRMQPCLRPCAQPSRTEGPWEDGAQPPGG